MASITSFFVQGLLLLCAYIGLLVFKQDSIIYMPRQYQKPLNTKTLLPHFNVEPLRFKTEEDGDQTAVLVQSAGDPCRRLFVTFGGNAMQARDWLEVLRDLPKAPTPAVCFLLVDYPGFGESGGSPSQAAIVRTASLALATAVEKLEQPEETSRLELGAWGHSIGCAASLALAAELGGGKLQLGHLVLSAPFTSLAGMAKTLLPFLKPVPNAPIEFLVWHHRWNNLRTVQEMATTNLPRIDIIHGLQDEIVPFDMGRELWQSIQALSGRGSFTEIEAGHNNLLHMAKYGDWFLRVLG